MSILLPVRPEYAKRIMSGEKKFEYRRMIPAREIHKIAIYVTSPAQKIVCVADVADTLSAPPEALWETTKDGGGISREAFDAYFKGCRTGHAFRLGDVATLPMPVSISEIGLDLRRPPRLFRYLGSLELERLLRVDLSLLYRLAAVGGLPKGFDRWELADKYGRTVAHAAAAADHLPKGFDRWELADGNGRTVAHTAADFGTLPKGFNRWELADDDGYTVAHAVTKYERLPKGFAGWDWADKDGWTVAHTAAMHGRLPAGFDRWELVDDDGYTVAHVAARYGHLPTRFDRWDLADKNGNTVRDVYNERERP
ncbi:MAG: hypothetical protein LBW85_01330 [Deltaproteobacteria bacterium]|nr:hypothetical protein [Deltaproteobacteria bacterium]